MHLFTYATEDSVLYEASSSNNFGLDEILEIRKDVDAAGITVDVSRILINFDLTHMSQSVQNAGAGSSNDAIVRRTMRKVKDLLLDYKPKDLFVIVGWSSPERKDFYYKGEWNSWETLYPAQLTQDFSYDKDLQEFYRIYLEKFWNEEEYIERYIQHNLLIHHFLNSYGIKHIFFDAFYETKDMGIYDKLNKDNLKQIKDIRKNNFIDKTFREVLMKGEYLDEELFGKDYHPTEKGHEIWARYLYDKVNNI